jgi:hypothetical protein
LPGMSFVGAVMVPIAIAPYEIVDTVCSVCIGDGAPHACRQIEIVACIRQNQKALGR